MPTQSEGFTRDFRKPIPCLYISMVPAMRVNTHIVIIMTVGEYKLMGISSYNHLMWHIKT